jgi:hypothetical protein|tara:strand:- start:1726 stop:2061 length:336 start_codon:yes stop_codon:yes gene_type:complete
MHEPVSVSSTSVGVRKTYAFPAGHLVVDLHDDFLMIHPHVTRVTKGGLGEYREALAEVMHALCDEYFYNELWFLATEQKHDRLIRMLAKNKQEYHSTEVGHRIYSLKRENM